MPHSSQSPSDWLLHYQQKWKLKSKLEQFSASTLKHSSQRSKISNYVPSQPQESQSQFLSLAIDPKVGKSSQNSKIKGSSSLRRDIDEKVGICYYPFKHAIDLKHTPRQVYTCDLCGVQLFTKKKPGFVICVIVIFVIVVILG